MAGLTTEPERVDANPAGIRAVIDTSTLYSARWRRTFEQAARVGRFIAIWSPWIIAELNRVLVWRWIELHNGDISRASQDRCADAATAMMRIMLPTFELVAPLPPYPPAWPSLDDPNDQPIWAAAKVGGAGYVVSENRRDYPPADATGRHIHEGIEYIAADAFLTLLPGRRESTV